MVWSKPLGPGLVEPTFMISVAAELHSWVQAGPGLLNPEKHRIPSKAKLQLFR